MVQHDGNLDTEDTLTKKDVTDGLADVHGGGVTSLQHVSINKLHALSTLSTDLTGNDNLTTLGRAVHNETEDTVASTTDGQTHHQLVAERLSLGNSAESTVLDTLGEEVDGALEKVVGKGEGRGRRSLVLWFFGFFFLDFEILRFLFSFMKENVFFFSFD